MNLMMKKQSQFIQRSHALRFAWQAGLTLVELMVAMALSLLVIAVALLSLMGVGQGLRSTSATAQLNDAAMLVTSVLQRSAAQAGYQPSGTETFTRETYYSAFNERPEPDVYGRDATQMATAAAEVSSSDISGFYAGGGGGGLATSGNATGNDLLAIRFQAVPETDEEKKGLTAMADLCTGKPLTTNPYDTYSAADRFEMHKPIYTFFVTNDVLYCKSWARAAGNTEAVATPVMDGVLAFEVLYGVWDRTTGAQGAPNQWKSASDMEADDWYRVKRIRVGLLLQSKVNAGPARNETAAYYPLGEGFYTSDDQGSKVTVNFKEGRVFRVVNFTVNVSNMMIPRNEQSSDEAHQG